MILVRLLTTDNMLKRITCILALALGAIVNLHAEKVSVSGSLEAYSSYIWRGSKECGANVVPCLSFNIGKFTLQSYGFLSFDGTYKEVDWDLSYSVGSFTFHLADYYARLASYQDTENYFSFAKGRTNHIQEAIICYEPQKLPFAVRWFTFIHGDWIPNSDGTLGKPSFSSYLEAEVYHDFTSAGRLSLLCGASVLKGGYTAYTKDFSVIHTELRYRYNLDLGKISMPLNISYVINPYRRASWLNAGVGIAF